MYVVISVSFVAYLSSVYGRYWCQSTKDVARLALGVFWYMIKLWCSCIIFAWLQSVLWMIFIALKLLVGKREGIWPLKNLQQFSPKKFGFDGLQKWRVSVNFTDKKGKLPKLSVTRWILVCLIHSWQWSIARSVVWPSELFPFKVHASSNDGPGGLLCITLSVLRN